MVSINSRHVWILIVLVLAFLAPTKSRGIAYITYDHGVGSSDHKKANLEKKR